MQEKETIDSHSTCVLFCSPTYAFVAFVWWLRDMAIFFFPLWGPYTKTNTSNFRILDFLTTRPAFRSTAVLV